MEEKIDVENNLENHQPEPKNNLDIIRKEAFENIYSKIQVIKEKHKQEKENAEEPTKFSLKNYNIDKVLSDNKLKEVFQLLEPNVSALTYNKFLSGSVNSSNTNRNAYSKYYSLFNDINKFNEKAKEKQLAKSINSFKNKVSIALKNSSTKNTMSLINKSKSFGHSKTISKDNMSQNQKAATISIDDYLSRTKLLIKDSKSITFNFSKTWNCNYFKKYNSNFYSDNLEKFDQKLSSISDYSSSKYRQNRSKGFILFKNKIKSNIYKKPNQLFW